MRYTLLYFNDTATTEIYTLSLHDALPISDGNEVPVGVVGELLIGGVQVGRGYLGRPALTAEWFVPDPFAPEPGARVYRTGDLARRLPGGEVDYLGRIDYQVKVRGLRIELGEIEAAILGQQGVREAVVLARGPAGRPAAGGLRGAGDGRRGRGAGPPRGAATGVYGAGALRA